MYPQGMEEDIQMYLQEMEGDTQMYPQEIPPIIRGLEKKHILIVESNARIADLLASILSDGMTVFIAGYTWQEFHFLSSAPANHTTNRRSKAAD